VAKACSQEDLAVFDLAQWQAAVAATLPQATTLVERLTAGNPSTYTIRIGWVDRMVDTTYAASDIDAGEGSNATGTGERFFYTATRTILDPQLIP
jgi:hypothetical protein